MTTLTDGPGHCLARGNPDWTEMSAHALVDLSCPRCHSHFIENAKLVRPGGNAWCPECEALFALDEGDEAMRRMLAEAKAARRRRKDRLSDLRLRWSDQPPARLAPAQPMLLSDVLKRLDELLLRLDADAEPSPRPTGDGSPRES